VRLIADKPTNSSMQQPESTVKCRRFGDNRHNRRLVLGGVLVFYVVTATVMALTMPWDVRTPTLAQYTPPDEAAHVAYLQELTTTGMLPRLTSGKRNYEAHQPPLYYLSAVPVYLAARAISSEGEGQPGVWDYTLLRMWSVLWGLASLVFAYYLGRLVFPDSWPLQVAVPAFLAALPSRTFICASVSNDVASELFSVISLVIMAGGLRKGFTTRRSAWLGVAIGLGLLSKSTCLALLPTALVAILLGAWTRKGISWRRALVNVTVVAAIVIALWGWWAARNVLLYGDPLATAAFKQAFSQDRATPEYFYSNPQLGFTPLMYAEFVLGITFLSFWGVFGQVSAFMPAGYYCLGYILTVALIVGLGAGIVRGLRRRRAEQQACRIWLVFGCMLIVVLVMFALFNMSFFQAQARYLFTANAVLAVVFVAGMSGLAAGSWRALPVWLAVGAVGFMSLWALKAMQVLSFQPLPPF